MPDSEQSQNGDTQSWGFSEQSLKYLAAQKKAMESPDFFDYADPKVTRKEDVIPFSTTKNSVTVYDPDDKTIAHHAIVQPDGTIYLSNGFDFSLADKALTPGLSLSHPWFHSLFLPGYHPQKGGAYDKKSIYE